MFLILNEYFCPPPLNPVSAPGKRERKNEKKEKKEKKVRKRRKEREIGEEFGDSVLKALTRL